MRRKADDASLPPTGDQLSVDPRPNKAIPQSERTRFILVHDLPPEGRDDGITSVRFEVPADGIIDDLKQAISDALTSSRLYYLVELSFSSSETFTNLISHCSRALSLMPIFRFSGQQLKQPASTRLLL